MFAHLAQVDLAGCFEDGQAYTALSRATALSKVQAIFIAVNARESIRVTGGNIDWIYPGRNERTSYTID